MLVGLQVRLLDAELEQRKLWYAVQDILARDVVLAIASNPETKGACAPKASLCLLRLAVFQVAFSFALRFDVHGSSRRVCSASEGLPQHHP